jgi:hypothetical protein
MEAQLSRPNTVLGSLHGHPGRVATDWNCVADKTRAASSMGPEVKERSNLAVRYLKSSWLQPVVIE